MYQRPVNRCTAPIARQKRSVSSHHADAAAAKRRRVDDLTPAKNEENIQLKFHEQLDRSFMIDIADGMKWNTETARDFAVIHRGAALRALFLIQRDDGLNCNALFQQSLQGRDAFHVKAKPAKSHD